MKINKFIIHIFSKMPQVRYRLNIAMIRGQFIKIFYWIFAYLSWIITSYAMYMSTMDNVKNINLVMTKVKLFSTIPVIFPTQIPNTANNKNLYANFDRISNSHWLIFIDSTRDCQGKHFCNIGSLQAEKNGLLNKTYSVGINQTKSKKVIMLADGQNAYFTPGHAEADWHAPQLEWIKNHVLYTLIWNVPVNVEQQVLLTMTNSAKHPGSN